MLIELKRVMIITKGQFLPLSIARDCTLHLYRDIEAHDTVEIRRRNLLEDPDVLEVEPWSVLCRRCQSRVELEGPDSYMIKKWLAHKAICHSRAAYVK